jgi:hypothetical protein
MLVSGTTTAVNPFTAPEIDTMNTSGKTYINPDDDPQKAKK